jgi:hypothetical protein
MSMALLEGGLRILLDQDPPGRLSAEARRPPSLRTSLF